MKKVLLSTVALLGLTVAAGAADLPRRTVAPAPIVAVPVFTWTGFYVGVNAGYGFGNSDDDNSGSLYLLPSGSVFGSPTTNATVSTFGNGNGNGDRDGFIGGGQIGYNIQFGTFVAGIEADLQYADLGGGRNNDGLFEGFGYVLSPLNGALVRGDAFRAPSAVVRESGGLSDLEWFGTVRGRLGVAFDRFLVYGTGGLAFGGTGGSSNNNGFCGGLAFGGCGDDDETEIGYAVGGGVEFAFTNNLTMKIEGLYVNLGDSKNSNGNFVGATFDLPSNQLFLDNGRGSKDLEFGLVRVGLNYKF